MNSIVPLTKIPTRTKAFARLWAMKFIAQNPTWRDGETYEDTWHAFGDYDLNLYCEDGYLSVSAYPMHKGEDGFMETDHSRFVHLVVKGETERFDNI